MFRKILKSTQTYAGKMTDSIDYPENQALEQE